MPPAFSSVLVLGLGALGLWAMRRGWQHRTRRTGALVPTLPAVPADGSADLGRPRTEPVEVTYVSTTMAGDWLDRVTAHDLGLRGPAVVQVFDGGVRILRPGATDLFVPAAAVRAAGTTPGIAGKVVGGDGIVLLTWRAPGESTGEGALLDTGLHARHRADRPRLVEAIATLARVDDRAVSSHLQEEES